MQYQLYQQIADSRKSLRLLLQKVQQSKEGVFNISFLGKIAQTDLHLVSLSSFDAVSLQTRLVEVNGVPVVNATAEELTELLLQGPSAQIVVLRHPPVGPTSLQHPPLPAVPGTAQNISLARAAVAMETPAQRKVITL